MTEKENGMSFSAENDGQFSICMPGQPRNIIFFALQNGVEAEVGRLDWDENGMSFSGNLQESAKVFFEYLRAYGLFSRDPQGGGSNG